MDTIDAGIAAEAVSSSRNPQHWGRAMASAVCRLAEKLDPGAGPDAHETLLSRELKIRITEDGPGVRISVWLEPDLLDGM